MGSESLSKQVNLLNYLRLLTRYELNLRIQAVQDLNYQAEAIKINIDGTVSTLAEQQKFFQQVYRDLKLSLFLSETDPNVCLLYNDGSQLQRKVPKEMLGFVIHSACQDHLQQVPMSAIMLFSELQAGRANEAVEGEELVNSDLEGMTVEQRRLTRIKKIESLEKNKHYPIKFIEFFILAIENKFTPQFKTLLREDNPRSEKEKTQNVDGDYMSFVDTYSYFIEEIQGLAENMSKHAKLISRFLSQKKFIKHMTEGVHNFIMKRLYRNLFDKMGQGPRDLRVEAYFKASAGAEAEETERKLRELLKIANDP